MSADTPTRAGALSPSKQALLRRMLQGKAAGEAPERIIPRSGAQGPFPLSFAQQRLWFIHQLDPSSSAYHMPSALRLRGRLDAATIRRSLEEVVRRHEILRTRFEVRDGAPVQVIDLNPRVELAIVDLSRLAAEAREAEARRLALEEAAAPFDLARGPLLRASLLRIDPEDHVFLVTLHHVVSDGWSMGVLVREVAALYE